jgi:preprotein translocase subunit SecE
VARDVALGRGGAADRPDRAPGEVQPARRGGFFGFIGESIAELKKVEWPGQNQVIQGTVVVLVACIIVGAYLWLNDQLWKEVVQKVLLK